MQVRKCVLLGLLAAGTLVSIGSLLAQEAVSRSPDDESGPELLRKAERLNAGLDGRADPLAAAKLYREAAATGDPVANLRLAEKLHYVRIGFKQDRARARRLVREHLTAGRSKAAAGDAMAQAVVGDVLSQAIGRPEPTKAEAAEAMRWLRSAAAAGKSGAMHSAAYLYAAGIAVAANPGLARGWFDQAIASGSCRAMSDLGSRSLYGRGVSKNVGLGLQLLERSSACSYPPGQYSLAWHLVYSDAANPETRERGIKLFEQALAGGYGAAGHDLGYLFGEGRFVARDHGRSVAAFEQGARFGSAAAQNSLGWALHNGLYGVSVDLGGAARWYAEAIIGGERRAMINLLNLRPSSVEAFDRAYGQILLPAAERGVVLAQAAVAHYNFDWLVSGPTSQETAIPFAVKAATAGDGDAMWVLGRAYDEGKGVAADPAAAMKWLKQGVEVGNPGCMLRLGHLYFVGKYTKEDPEAGMRLTRQAADKRWLPAVNRLAEIHEKGLFGGPIDRREAMVWYRIAAEMGDKEAIGRVRYEKARRSDGE